MRELVNSSASSHIESEVKIRQHGKNIAKNEASTRQLPMAHELITSAQDSCSELPSQKNIAAKGKGIIYFYIHQIFL